MIRFECHVPASDPQDALIALGNMQPFDALVVKVEKISNEDESIVSLKIEIFLNGKLVAQS